MKFMRILLLLGALFGLCRGAGAEDTDLFNANPAIVSARPNVLIILDNTANWNTPFTYEIAALNAVIGALSSGFNVGLMMFTETGSGNPGPSGSYVRYAMQQMTTTNRSALLTLVNGFRSNSDQGNAGKAALAMYEAYRYFTSAASYAGGPAGNNSNGKAKSDAAAFASGTANYSMPNTACGNNFIIYISNGPAQESANDTRTAETLLSGVGGDASTIAISPNDSQSSAADEFARFMVASSKTITTYTVDVNPGTNRQGLGWTRLLKEMAIQGKGAYKTSSNASSLELALNDIFAEVQAVNSVFASSTLPVSVNVRGTYLNQVYMGVFRPDANNSPRWPGNLKLYSLAPDASDSLILVDKNGVAAENASKGFIKPTATSYWTTTSTFWTSTFTSSAYSYASAQGSGGASDAPDGDLIEKGGAAQKLRSTYLTSVTARKLYTCVGSCSTGDPLSSWPLQGGNGANDVSTTDLGAANNTERDAIVAWVKGANNKTEDNPDGLATSIRGYVHGDVLHSRPAVINYNRNGDDNDIVVYYGANDGIFRAIKGGTGDTDGVEKWGFVPKEFFSKLKRQRDESPIIGATAADTKPYFADGPISVYQYDANNDGIYRATDGDKVYIYIGMRRGGRVYYALDVSDPDNPKFMWKITGGSGDFAELGQSWSEPKVARVRLTGQTNPVLIFGLGYDAAANDPLTQGTATMGRGVMMVDAVTGTLIWQAGPVTQVPEIAAYRTVSGMNYAIAAAPAVIDSNGDGYADRIYAADTGANIWRFNINDTVKTNWTVSQLASLGGSGVNARKFLFPPDVILAGTIVTTDTLLIGSGDREHPLDTTIANRYYMIKDDHGLTATPSTVVTEGTAGSNSGVAGKLLDVTSNLIQVGTASEQAAATTSLATAAGWYVRLAAGEKSVSGSATLAGTVFFSTNIPPDYSSDACVSSLGTAYTYALSYTDGSAKSDLDASGTITTADRAQLRAGGGFPPSPVPVSVRIGGKDYQSIISGTKVLNPSAPSIGRRYRTYWQRLID